MCSFVIGFVVGYIGMTIYLNVRNNVEPFIKDMQDENTGND